MNNLRLQAEQQQKQQQDARSWTSRLLKTGRLAGTTQEFACSVSILCAVTYNRSKASKAQRTKEATQVRKQSYTVRQMSTKAMPVCDTHSYNLILTDMRFGQYR